MKLDGETEKHWTISREEGAGLLWEGAVRLTRPEVIDLLGRLLCRRLEPDEIIEEVRLARAGKEPNLFAIVAEGEILWTREGLLHYRATPAQLPEGEVQ